MRKSQNLGMIDNALLHKINKLVSENASLKQQVLEQQKIMNDIKLHDISKSVAKHIDDWLNIPYLHGKTQKQDLNEFAFRLTKYIDYKLKH